MDFVLLSRPCDFSTCSSNCSSFAPSYSPLPFGRVSPYAAASTSQVSLKDVGKWIASKIPTSERSLNRLGRISSANWVIREILKVGRFCLTPYDNAGGGQPEINGPVADETLMESSDSVMQDVGLLSGSLVVLVEVPAILKAAEPMPMMRPNRGLLKSGEAGRAIDRRPKNMWAMRFAVGSYLIDRKCFEPMDS